jgi:xylan 1,4-beta-xylosidase
MNLPTGKIPKYRDLPIVKVNVDAAAELGPFEPWRYSVGQGGVSPDPWPPRLIEAIARLKPRLVRVFIQEYFTIYPDHNTFDWTKLDAFMAALAATGAKVVAAITIKPKVLFPALDQESWRPNNVAEWQNVIRALAQRYTVEKGIVSHWEIGNETDIGEDGGCPFHIPHPKDYLEYYQTMSAPILEVCPEVKVGGPAVCGFGEPFIEEFINLCKATGTRLDFVTWHTYINDIDWSINRLRDIQGMVKDMSPRPELMITEHNVGFDKIRIDDFAYEPRRAAGLAAHLFALIDGGLDWAFHYTVWDQLLLVDQWAPWYAAVTEIHRNTTGMPIAMGMFGEQEEVRPQYFVYRMLNMLGEQRIQASAETPQLVVQAAKSPGGTAAMLVNRNLDEEQELLATVRFDHLEPRGIKMLRVNRLDAEQHWTDDTLELIPTEQRRIDMVPSFECQVYCPTNSVVLITIGNV